MIQLTVFLSGAALMALEMLGSRMLAPTFGNSIFVWGSLIGVVLTALSAGYYAGGKLADRFPAPAPLAMGVAFSGLWVWLLPAISANLTPWVARLDLGPRLGPLLASLLLFAGPSVLMALVSPWAIRLTARSVASMGSTAGALSALSTGGSIVGTLATTFLLIPAMGVASLVRSIGLMLVALAGLNLLLVRRFKAASATALALVAMLALGLLLPEPGSMTAAAPPPAPPSERSATSTGTQVAGTSSTPTQPPAVEPAKGEPSKVEPPKGEPSEVEPPKVESPPVEPAAVGPIAGGKENGVVFHTESLYHRIQVQNDNGTRLLRFDESYQSGMYLDDPLKTRFEYTDVMMLPVALRPNAKRALLVGLGGGSMVKQLIAGMPKLHLDVAELDPAVITAARTYFGVPEHPRLAITAQDGRQYMVQATNRYDVVLLDAYYASAIPFHLTTREFMQIAHDRMTPTGVLAANIISSIEGPRSALIRSIVATMAAVFPQVYLVPVGTRPADQYQNVIVLATMDDRRMQPADLVRAAQAVAGTIGAPTLPDHAARMVTKPVSTTDVKILTDDFAPVDNLMHLYR